MGPQISTNYHLQARRALFLPHLAKMASPASQTATSVKTIKRDIQRQGGHQGLAKEISQKKKQVKVYWIIRPL